MSSSFNATVIGPHGIITQTSGKGTITTTLPDPMPPDVSVEYQTPDNSSWTPVTGDRIQISNGQQVRYRAIRSNLQGMALLPLGFSPLAAHFTFKWDNTLSIVVEVAEEGI